MYFEFVWDKKRDNIKKKAIAVHSISRGCINVPHIKANIRSLKLTWVKKLGINTEMTKWKKMLQYSCPDLAGFKATKIKTNPFWNDTFQA